MNLFINIRNIRSSLPKPVKIFLLRALFIFIVWKTLYNVILLPIKFPDRQLTYITAVTTMSIYNVIHGGNSSSIERSDTPLFTAMAFYVNKEWALGIADPCNGLELYILYISFLFCVPFPFKRRVVFATIGVAVIFILNVLRCYALARLNLNNIAFADFAHHYFFKMIVYAAIFYLWVKYCDNYFRYE